MESFVHLRKGRTPRRLHADLDGLKDDELGRGGVTGRTANMYRRHDQRDKLRESVGIVTDWLIRHDLASAG